jgi:hypothetical protein
MANAVKAYNGGSAFLLKPNGIDSRTVNKLLYTPSQIPQQGIVANYDPAHPDSYSGTGTSLFDLSGNGQTITLNGGLESGYVQNGWFTADNVNDYGQSGTNSVTINGTALTMGIWMRLNSFPTGNFNIGLGAFQNGTLFGNFIDIRKQSSQLKARSRYQDSAGTLEVAQDNSNLLSVGTWYYIASTFDSATTTMVLYLFDGSGLVNSVTETVAICDFVTNPIVGSIVYNGVSGFYTPLSTGEAHMYNGIALSQGRIENIYENTKARYGY